MSNLETERETDEEDEEDIELTFCPQCGTQLDDPNLGCWNCGYAGFDADEAESTGEE